MRRRLPANTLKTSFKLFVPVILLGFLCLSGIAATTESEPTVKKSESLTSSEKKIDSLLKVIAVNGGSDEILQQNKEVYSKLAELLFQSRNYALALDYYFRILRIIDKEEPDSIGKCGKYTDLYSQIGLCYFSIAYPINPLNILPKPLKHSASVKERWKTTFSIRKEQHCLST